MPPRRYTRSQLEFSGALKRNPERYSSRTDNSTLPPIGNCPRHLSLTQKALWKELVALAPNGLLTSADRFSVELAAKLLERSRTQVLKASEITTLVSLLGKLGLTPLDRARLDIPAPKTEADGEFDEF